MALPNAWKTAAKWAFSVGLGVLFIWLAFRDVDGSKLWRAIRDADYAPLVPFFAVLAVIQVIKAARWGLLLRPLGRLGAWRTFIASNSGWMFAILVPFRMGEFARPYLVSEHGGISMSAALATIIVERVLDGLIATILFFVSSQLITGYAVPAGLLAVGYIAFAIFVGALLAIIGTVIWHDASIRFWTRLLSLISKGLAKKLVGILENFHVGLRAIPRRRDLALFVGYSALYWGASALSFFILFRAFGIDVSFVGAVFLMTTICLAIMVPGGPANAGTFEAGVTTALVSVFALDAATAAAYAIVIHTTHIIAVMAFGVPSLFSRHGSLTATAHRRRAPTGSSSRVG